MLQKTIISIYKENPHYFAINGKTTFLPGVDIWTPIHDTSVNYRAQNEVLERIGATCNRIVTFFASAGEQFIYPWPRVKGYGKTLDRRDKFNLSRFNDTYWERLKDYIEDCSRRGLAVNLEIFDECSLEKHRQVRWFTHPFDPVNNFKIEFQRPRYRKE